MVDDSAHGLLGEILREDLLRAVASENLDAIPDEFGDEQRFIVSSIRAAAQRVESQSTSAFVYSEAPRSDVAEYGFQRIAHMQDGHGSIDGSIIVTNQDANNGMHRSCALPTPDGVMDELELLAFGNRCTVIWDAGQRVATVYPKGVLELDDHVRCVVTYRDTELSQSEVCGALDLTYNENLKNPSAHTIRLWTKDGLVSKAEDEIERHIKGQLTMYFLGHQRRVKILSQTNTNAGRSDLIFLQHFSPPAPSMMGVLELKVLRGPETQNRESTTEGLSQGYHYRNDLQIPFAVLALFDVAIPPSSDVDVLLDGQDANMLENVHTIRYPIYNSPRAWRDAALVAAN